jgi:hypothetical protein
VSIGNPSTGDTSEDLTRYRCAIDLIDHKRGTFRAERLNDIFRLLDIRHQIHEKAVYHRVVQSAIAMLSRTGLILRKHNKLPELLQLYGLDDGFTPALAGDERFLEYLVNSRVEETSEPRNSAEFHQSLPCKLAERRVYRPLVVIPGDRLPVLFKGIYNPGDELEHPLRELAALVDSTYCAPFFLLISALIEKLLQHAIESEDAVNAVLKSILSDNERLSHACDAIPKRVIFWTTPYKQLYKDPAILVCASESLTTTIERLQTADESISDALKERVRAGIRDAETKNEGLWKLYVFLSDGLFYTGALARLIKEHPCGKDSKAHEAHLRMAQNIVVRSLRSVWQHWQAQGKLIELGDSIDPSDLSELLSRFISSPHFAQTITPTVSAVKVGQYAHGDDSPKCRDVRYKFDSGKSFAEILDDTGKDTKTKELIREALEGLAVNLDGIRSEELAEIVGRLSRDVTRLRQLIDAEKRGESTETVLRSLWLDEFQIPDAVGRGTAAQRVGPRKADVSQQARQARVVRVFADASNDNTVSDRSGQFTAVCKLFIKTNFEKYEATLVEWHKEHLGRVPEDVYSGFMHELRRSAAGTPRGRRRDPGDDLQKLLLFFENLRLKTSMRIG